MVKHENRSVSSKTRSDPTTRIVFGQRVRELRKSQGYSQERFAAASGLDRSYFGRIERGEQNVSLDNIAAIARTLEVPIGTLFDSSTLPRDS